MAGLKIFVSSTCVDLGAQRAQVRALLERMGYEPVMSEYSDVLFDHRIHTHTSCIRDVTDVDMVILLIGSRFGGEVIPAALSEVEIDEVAKTSNKSELVTDADRLSITQVEILKAIESDIPIFAFVDAKVLSDHHLYQRNKNQSFAADIVYPSIEKPETARYIFDFINFITHRFANNAITPYATFSDIEDHLVKQWSLTFQRMLREERNRSLEGRRSDIMIEQLQDLKAAVLQTISAGSGRDIARSVLRYRRLVDFLLQMRRFNLTIDLAEFQGSFDELLAEFGVTDMRPISGVGGAMMARTILNLSDGTYLRVRIPDRRFLHFAVEWKGFSQLDRDTKKAVLDGVEDSESVGISMIFHVTEPYTDDDGRTGDIDAEGEPMKSSLWTDERIATLRTFGTRAVRHPTLPKH